MSAININRNVHDVFYRYKMPRIIAKIEGKGNGIKTVIVNMSEVAKALSRPPTYPTKYFGCELGAQTKFDLKNDRYIINGAHNAEKLQEILDGFIKKFVLCPACENPETTFTVKSKSISGKCKACGHIFTIDPKHKLSAFIQKNPPANEAGELETSRKEDIAIIQDLMVSNECLKDLNARDDDDDWGTISDNDKSQKLNSGIGKLVIDSDLDKTADERLDMLFEFFGNAKANGTITNTKEMLNEAERLEVMEKATLLLCNLLFDTDILKQIKQYRTLFLRFCLHNKEAQTYLLGGIEQLIKAHTDVLLPKAAVIIKKLYDEDICVEEAILAWGSKHSKFVKKNLSEQIREQCKPLFEWLEEAEEESESDQEDDNIEFDDRARQLGTVAVKESETKKLVEENDEDIDIDNI